MAKTKALISFAVTAKLICVFVYAYAKNWFSHEESQIKQGLVFKLIDHLPYKNEMNFFKRTSTYVITDGKHSNKLQKEVSVFCSNGTSRNFRGRSKGQKHINKGRSQWLS